MEKYALLLVAVASALMAEMLMEDGEVMQAWTASGGSFVCLLMFVLIFVFE